MFLKLRTFTLDLSTVFEIVIYASVFICVLISQEIKVFTEKISAPYL